MSKIRGLVFLMPFIGVFSLVAGCAEDGKAGADGGVGISGSNGADGTDGTDGNDGNDGGSTTVGEIFHVGDTLVEDIALNITAAAIGATSTIDFEVLDDMGRGGIGVVTGSGGDVRFAVAKLMPGTGGDLDAWQSYINRASSNDAATNTVMQATYERSGILEDFGDGTYTYTFEADLTDVTNPVDSTSIPFDETLTHRVAIQAGGNLPSIQVTHDFVPDGAAISVSHDVAMTDSCNECHGSLKIHGSRYEVKYCVTCHNPGTTDPENDASGDMAVMTHKIHMGKNLANGYELGGHDYSEVGYPQPEMLCRKCHSGDDTDTPQGNNWQIKPTMETCGACHDDVDFAAGTNHAVAANNSGCAGCHGASAINGYHITENATPNNPDLPTGVLDITYEILSASVNGSNVATIEFNIYADGTRLDMTALPAALTTEGRFPSFLLPYALDQNGVPSADWNNLGLSAGQPAGADIDDLLAGTGGNITDDGTKATATITGAFPAGSYLRAVALQGYFRQTMTAPGDYVARHAPSAYMAVTGDDERREIIDNDKCLACHEIIEAHGGNRVDNVMVCATCHVPNLSTSGRTSTSTGGDAELIYGTNHLLYPEDTNNTRDLIHGLHASAMRNEAYKFVRIRSGNEYPFDFSHVTYPGVLEDCTACHNNGTFKLPLDADLLPSTVVTGGEGLANPAAVTAARASLPNDEDIIVSPMSGSCYYCHDSAASAAHMEQNGGAIKRQRSDWIAEAPFETCEVCHGDGKMADVNLVHGLE